MKTTMPLTTQIPHLKIRPTRKILKTLEAEIHDAVAQGSNVEEAVQHPDA